MNDVNFESILSEFAPTTQQIYANVWRRWQNWCSAKGIVSHPIPQETFNLFVAEMREGNRSGQYLRHFLSVLRRINEAVGHFEELVLDSNRVVKFRPPYYLMNSAMMPAAGIYHLVEMERDDWVKAIQRANAEQPVRSYIGYPDTAKHVQEITGLPIEVNRSETMLGDAATMFIVKLKYRVNNPADKGQFTPTDADYAYYVAKYSKV